LLVKQLKENNLRKSIVGKTLQREQPRYKYCWQNSGKRTTYVKVVLVKQWKESYLRKSIVGKTVEREQPT
jgi:DNA-binding HxlR family transcriptional regulator